ncbi:hypothetical protein D9758_011997 [Tetrapyrgos nigripes]|uniref:Uncharacterized protein n=1 Tax=Tetrapyrgos nigripes TaxID=182062 RepID=A0A8H5CR51_9AGAR|nr:hypothetical protein D9758_011997 [Tetrapyrgos nigripes]
MLFFNSSSRLRASTASNVLVLTTRHCLQAPSNADSSHTIRNTRFFDVVNVLSHSPIVFTLSGLLDRVPVTQQDMLKSQIANHLLEYFRTNASQLGLSNVSDIYVDGRMTGQKSPSRPKVYSWQTQSREDSSRLALSPFSSQLSLPFRGLVDNVVGRFVTWHLVRRYPLILGTWCKQLDMEATFFPTIFRSILEMAKRSSNPTFRARFKELLKILKRQQLQSYEASHSSLSEYLGSETDLGDQEDLKMNQETAFCLSMESLYFTGSKRANFKSSAGNPLNPSDALDDDELSHDQSILPSENSTTSISADEPWAVGSSYTPHTLDLDGLCSDLDVPVDISGKCVESGYNSDYPLGIQLSSDDQGTQDVLRRSPSPWFIEVQDFLTHEDDPASADFSKHLSQSDEDIDIVFDQHDYPLPLSQPPQYTHSSQSSSQLLYPDGSQLLQHAYSPQLLSQLLHSDDEDLDLPMEPDLDHSKHPLALSFSQPFMQTPPSLTSSQLSHSDEDLDINMTSDLELMVSQHIPHVADISNVLDDQDYGTYSPEPHIMTLSCQPDTALPPFLSGPYSDTEDLFDSDPEAGNTVDSSSYQEQAHTMTPTTMSFQDVNLDFSDTEQDLDLQVDTDMEIADFDDGWGNSETERATQDSVDELTQCILDIDQGLGMDHLLEHEEDRRAARLSGSGHEASG